MRKENVDQKFIGLLLRRGSVELLRVLDPILGQDLLIEDVGELIRERRHAPRGSPTHVLQVH